LIDLIYVVLYSIKDSLWKLADFGFTSEATSGALHFSMEAKGTSGYRAPELIESGVYNNKADIWSLGCILYEFTVGQKAFEDDFATHDFKTSGKILKIILGEDIGEKDKDGIVEVILNTLNIEYSSRPSASNLLSEFSSSFQSIQLESTDIAHIREVVSGSLLMFEN
jgi:serine/threonine protein kinase